MHLDEVSGQLQRRASLNAFDSLTMIKSILASMRLRNRKHLIAVVLDGLSAAFPGLSRQALEHKLGNEIKLPSASSISRKQLQLGHYFVYILEGAICQARILHMSLD